MVPAWVCRNVGRQYILPRDATKSAEEKFFIFLSLSFGPSQMAGEVIVPSRCCRRLCRAVLEKVGATLGLFGVSGQNKLDVVQGCPKLWHERLLQMKFFDVLPCMGRLSEPLQQPCHNFGQLCRRYPMRVPSVRRPGHAPHLWHGRSHKVLYQRCLHLFMATPPSLKTSLVILTLRICHILIARCDGLLGRLALSGKEFGLCKAVRPSSMMTGHFSLQNFTGLIHGGRRGRAKVIKLYTFRKVICVAMSRCC